MPSTTALEPAKEQLLEPRYITINQATFFSGLGRSSIYNIVKDPTNKVRTKAFSLSKARKKKVRLIHYGDLVAYLDRLPIAGTLAILKTPPEIGFITFVNAAKIKSSNPGCCFKKAGWQHVGFTQGGLYAFQLPSSRFPQAIAPLRRT